MSVPTKVGYLLLRQGIDFSSQEIRNALSGLINAMLAEQPEDELQKLCKPVLNAPEVLPLAVRGCAPQVALRGFCENHRSPTAGVPGKPTAIVLRVSPGIFVKDEQGRRVTGVEKLWLGPAAELMNGKIVERHLAPFLSTLCSQADVDEFRRLRAQLRQWMGLPS